eukprot:scaffold33937_cov30-Tisochrysis_lutea.AAC.6
MVHPDETSRRENGRACISVATFEPRTNLRARVPPHRTPFIVSGKAPRSSIAAALPDGIAVWAPLVMLVYY